MNKKKDELPRYSFVHTYTGKKKKAEWNRVTVNNYKSRSEENIIR